MFKVGDYLKIVETATWTNIGDDPFVTSHKDMNQIFRVENATVEVECLKDEIAKLQSAK